MAHLAAQPNWRTSQTTLELANAQLDRRVASPLRAWCGSLRPTRWVVFSAPVVLVFLACLAIVLALVGDRAFVVAHFYAKSYFALFLYCRARLLYAGMGRPLGAAGAANAAAVVAMLGLSTLLLARRDARRLVFAGGAHVPSSRADFGARAPFDRAWSERAPDDDDDDDDEALLVVVLRAVHDRDATLDGGARYYVSARVADDGEGRAVVSEALRGDALAWDPPFRFVLPLRRAGDRRVVFGLHRRAGDDDAGDATLEAAAVYDGARDSWAARWTDAPERDGARAAVRLAFRDDEDAPTGAVLAGDARETTRPPTRDATSLQRVLETTVFRVFENLSRRLPRACRTWVRERFSRFEEDGGPSQRTF